MNHSSHAPHATYEDADLILRLYDLRREEKLRKARDWFLREFSASSVKDFMEKYPPGGEQNAWYRMVVSYWEMAASFLVQGIIHEELFFQSSGEMLGVWEKVKPLMPELRAWAKNPLVLHNLEEAATKYIAWMNKHAPGSYEVMQEWMRKPAAKS